MLFNSIEFAVFFPIVFVIYWFIFKRNVKLQNIFLLLSSCYFYACWDWRFLFLLLVSIGLVYYPGKFLASSKTQNQRKIWLWVSIVFSVGFLGLFKYYNFFIASFSELLSNIGFQVNTFSLELILPVGISFYTFHGLSYIIDLYYNKIEEEKNFVNYALFVSFFPLLIAGPIERATHLLPQIKRQRTFEYAKAVDGLRQILWGLFKKIVIADNCAEYANLIFNNSSQYGGPTLILGAIFFTFQIYCDFSGYSDIALGVARILGFDLLKNFSFPYFSRDIAEFWRRWHISLTTWFRDYVYIPLGGSRGSKWSKIRNTFIIFLISGFWHGANWTFIAWGFLNALYFIPLLLSNKNRNNLDIVAKGKLFPSFNEFFKIILTFGLTVLAWIFFRADSLSIALRYIYKVAQGLLHKWRYIEVYEFINKYYVDCKLIIILLFVFIIIEWIGRENQYAIEKIGLKWKSSFRYLFYYLIIMAIFWFAGSEQQFIYFQF